MATQVSLVDDFDPETPATETVAFVFEDEAYVIDLSAENAGGFRAAMAPYVEHATKLGKHKLDRNRIGAARKNGHAVAAVSAAPKQSATATAALPQMVNGKPWYAYNADDSRQLNEAKREYRQRARRYGQDNGWNLGDRGRIPAEVFEAYEQDCRRRGKPTGPASVGLSRGS